MTMRGGLSIATAGTRPRFASARPVHPLWLAEMRRLLIADEPGAASRVRSVPNRFGRTDFERPVQKRNAAPAASILDAAR